MMISGSHEGSTGSTKSVSSGATGWKPSRLWMSSGNALAFHNCGVLARGYAPGPLRS